MRTSATAQLFQAAALSTGGGGGTVSYSGSIVVGSYASAVTTLATTKSSGNGGAVQANSSILVAVSTGSTAAVTSITTNGATAYTATLVSAAVNVWDTELWILTGGSAVSASLTVTVHFSASCNPCVFLVEATSSLSRSPTVQGTPPAPLTQSFGSTTQPCPTATPTSSGCAIINVMWSGSNLITIPSSPWTAAENTSGSNSDQFGVATQAGVASGTGYASSWVLAAANVTTGLACVLQP